MENIKVATRIKPEEENMWVVQAPNIIYSQGRKGKACFNFDHCFKTNISNLEVYNESIKAIVLGSLKGINGTVFAYGQTGSGKTYTMLGGEQEQGVLLHALHDLFSMIEQDLDKTYVLRCSYIEIYNEQIFDLLKPPSRLTEVLTVSEDTKKDFFVKGVTEESVSSLDEVLQSLKRGERNRHYAQTAMNHHSSRSHAIFRLSVQSITNTFIRNYRREQSQLKLQTINEVTENPTTQGALITESLLNFVDLAGSEKVSNHTNSVEDATQILESFEGKIKDRIKEGQYINKSLFFLTQVIYLKAEEKSHIPYRNSSLTKILRSSLGGNSRTLIILCLNPSIQQYDYTISTLRFGLNAKKISNSIVANIRNQDDDEAMKILLSEYEKKIRDLEKARSEEKETIEFLQKELENQRNKNASLESRLIQNNRKQFSTTQYIFPQNKQDSLHIDSVGELAMVKNQNKKSNEQNHDCKGRIVLSAYRLIKERNKSLEQQITQLISNYYTLKNDYLSLHTYLNYYKEKLQILTEEYEEGLLNCKEIYRMALDQKQKYDLNGLQNLTAEQLTDLKSFYSAGLKQLEQEEWKRQIIVKIECKNNKSLNNIRKLPKSPEELLLEIIQSPTSNQECQIKKIGKKLFSKETREIDESHQSQKRLEKAQQLDLIFFNGYDSQILQSNEFLTFEQLEEEVNKDNTMVIHNSQMINPLIDIESNGLNCSMHYSDEKITDLKIPILNEMNKIVEQPRGTDSQGDRQKYQTPDVNRVTKQNSTKKNKNNTTISKASERIKTQVTKEQNRMSLNQYIKPRGKKKSEDRSQIVKSNAKQLIQQQEESIRYARDC